MSRRYVFIGFGSLAVLVIAVLTYYVLHDTVSILQPAGPIAAKERGLIVLCALLAILVVVPVFTMTTVIVWRYRAGNHQARYQPDFDHSRLAESIWWLIPTALIAVLAVVAWQSSHRLDPTVALVSSKPALQVQVVALQWKWLFIYPQQNVASVNRLELPVGRPVHFLITSDAPMNSFWIPQLGGQIYAMSGMVTQLNLEADKAGDYYGSSANISGTGFADMAFMTHAAPAPAFDQWVRTAKRQGDALDAAGYMRLSAPGDGSIKQYRSVMPDLFNDIVNSYMAGNEHVTMEALR